jgi:iron-sulfur cluster assembly accessory protein
MTVGIFEVQSMNVTDNAAVRIKSIVKDAPASLRIHITGGGCSGFKYVFSLDDNAAVADDTVVTHQGATVLIDALSIQYLAGSVLDYSETLAGSNFVITNPLAKGTCGCGESFTV